MIRVPTDIPFSGVFDGNWFEIKLTDRHSYLIDVNWIHGGGRVFHPISLVLRNSNGVSLTSDFALNSEASGVEDMVQQERYQLGAAAAESYERNYVPVVVRSIGGAPARLSRASTGGSRPRRCLWHWYCGAVRREAA